jgi:hypothetical protein
MAWIEKRTNGFLVLWRPVDTGEKTSRLVRWTTEADEPGDEFDVTKAQAFAQAERLCHEKAKIERRARQPLERVRKANAQDYPGWTGDLFTVESGPAELRFENYLRSIIERDELTESSRATYLHSLRNHVEGTAFGRKDIALIEPRDVEDFWDSLDGLGIAARRNVGALLAQGVHPGGPPRPDRRQPDEQGRRHRAVEEEARRRGDHPVRTR